MNAHFGKRTVDQHHGPQHHGHRPSHAQNAVRRELGLEHEQGEGQQHEGRAQPVDGQHRYGGKSQQHENGSHHAWSDQPRRRELDIQAQRADHQQHQGDIGIGDGGDHRLAQRLLIDLDDRPGGVERLRAAVEARDHAAIQGGKQGLLVGRDEIGQVLFQRLALGERLAFADRGFRQRAVAPALGADAAQVGGGVILHFLFHDGVHFAAHQHGVRRAGVGSRGHGRHVAGLQDEEARGSGASSAGRDIGHYRDGRGDDLLDNLAHRIHQPAGRVETDEEQRRVLRFRLRDGAAHDFNGDGVHHAVHVHRNYFWGGKRGLRQ